MPFSFKNTGATYIDLLVKSKQPDHHIEDLKEAFSAFQQYKMKLDPSKCAFKVHLGIYDVQKRNWGEPWENQGHPWNVAANNYQQSIKADY